MDPGLAALLGIVKDGGPWAMAAIFAYLWWDERAEKRKCQAARDTLQAERLKDARADGERVTTALINSTTVLEQQGDLIKSLGDLIRSWLSGRGAA